jgi:YXWGXW repeat-containing protein
MRIISRSVRLLLFALVLLSLSAAAFAQIGISVSFGPPALPVYEQPICPQPGYLWTPGYWAWDPDINDYYWVPGTWVLAPEVGFLWTPPWWGWEGGVFLFHEGYWGPHVGFYGGIAYGFGYFGRGFEGGRWDNGQFFYNRSVTNINVTNIHNVYNTTVINNNVTVNRVSYNGSEGGITARPTPEEESAARERHVAPVAAQTEHIQAARSNPQLRASVNQGRPAIAATPRPGAFNDRGTVKAKAAGAPYTPRPQGKASAPAERGGNNVPRPPASHASELQSHERPPAPNTGNPKLDQKYQQQQNKLYSKMDQEHQKLQQKQDQEHQRLQQRNASEAQKQQVEQKHQQQTQQLEQRHQQQIQHLQERQQPRPPGRK